MVLGNVNKPSAFSLPQNEKISVMRAIADAGGPSPNAELRKAGMMRLKDGKSTYIPLDLDKAIRKGSKNPKLTEQMNSMMMQDGDVIYIPEKGRPFLISDYLTPFFVLSSLGMHPF
jgi:protein involved in polysaccharide export with SLBB domain